MPAPQVVADQVVNHKGSFVGRAPHQGELHEEVEPSAELVPHPGEVDGGGQGGALATSGRLPAGTLPRSNGLKSILSKTILLTLRDRGR